MGIRFEQLGEQHRTAVIDIFNHYVENDFAAYIDSKVPYSFFDMFLNITRGYPAYAVVSDSDIVVGYSFLRAYNPMPAFKTTAEISYFFRPDMTGKGIGGLVLDRIETEAKKAGIKLILANVSSLNEKSIQFHLKHGFTPCGRFKGVGTKFGTEFDVVWFQKDI